MGERPQLTLTQFLLLILLLVASAALVCKYQTEECCDMIDVRDFPSPHGHHLVTTFGFDCHNTTGHDVHLQLRSPGAKLQVPGNIYTIAFGGEFTVSWRSPSNVVVRLTEALPDATNIMGVTVTFAKLSLRN